MENVSFKHWIVAGALSGVVIGILVLFVITPVFEVKIKFPALIFTFIDYIFYGIVIGVILFLIRNKLQQRKLFKSLLVSIGVVMGSLLFGYFVKGITSSSSFYDFFASFWMTPYFIYFFLSLKITSWFNIQSHLFVWLIVPHIFNLLIGLAFGLLINYFINRMERKPSK